MTLLVGLTKVRHPNIISAIDNTVDNWQRTYGSKRNRFDVVKKPNSEIVLTMNFGKFSETTFYSYLIYFERNSFHLSITKWGKTDSYKSKKVIANIVNIPYTDDPEALLFQYSVIHELCMFGIQEFEAVKRFRNRYWRIE